MPILEKYPKILEDRSRLPAGARVILDQVTHAADTPERTFQTMATEHKYAIAERSFLLSARSMAALPLLDGVATPGPCARWED